MLAAPQQVVPAALTGRAFQRYLPPSAPKNSPIRLTVGTVPLRLRPVAEIDIDVVLSLSTDAPTNLTSLLALARTAQHSALHSALSSPAPVTPPALLPRGPRSLSVQHRRWHAAAEALTVASSRGTEWILSKGGWEQFERALPGAARETYEEAGVTGVIAAEGACYVEHQGPTGLPATSAKGAAAARWRVPHALVSFPLVDVLEHVEYPERMRGRGWVSLASSTNIAAGVAAAAAVIDGSNPGAGPHLDWHLGLRACLRRPPAVAAAVGVLASGAGQQLLAQEAAGSRVAADLQIGSNAAMVYPIWGEDNAPVRAQVIVRTRMLAGAGRSLPTSDTASRLLSSSKGLATADKDFIQALQSAVAASAEQGTGVEVVCGERCLWLLGADRDAWSAVNDPASSSETDTLPTTFEDATTDATGLDSSLVLPESFLVPFSWSAARSAASAAAAVPFPLGVRPRLCTMEDVARLEEKSGGVCEPPEHLKGKLGLPGSNRC